MNNENSATFLISSLTGGGAEGVCVNLANSLAQKGWVIDLIVMNTKNAVYIERVNKKVNLIELNVNHVRYAFLPLYHYIQKSKPKVFLVFNYELTVLLVLLRVIFKKKFKLVARNINTISAKREQAKKGGFWSKNVITRLVDRFYCKSDHVINQCKAMEQDLLEVYPELKDKTSVIYNPVAKHIENYTTTHNLSDIEKENYFLSIGRLEPQKGLQHTIRAFAEVNKSHPDMFLKILGQGSLEEELKNLVRILNIEDKVIFKGFQINTIPYYLKAKATILTSHYEGFPNVLVESITLGTPVIAFNCPSGPSEIIQDGINGYLVDFMNEEMLINKMNEICINEIKPSKVTTTKSKFSVDSILSHYIRILKD